MLTCRLWAMFGSSPSVTNSPVPIPKPPSASASSARLTGPIVRRGRAIIESSLVIVARALVAAPGSAAAQHPLDPLAGLPQTLGVLGEVDPEAGRGAGAELVAGVDQHPAGFQRDRQRISAPRAVRRPAGRRPRR